MPIDTPDLVGSKHERLRKVSDREKSCGKEVREKSLYKRYLRASGVTSQRRQRRPPGGPGGWCDSGGPGGVYILFLKLFIIISSSIGNFLLDKAYIVASLSFKT